MLKANTHGFSLIELVLTVVILGIIAIVSLPKFFNQNTFDERFFHDDLLSASRYAARLATASGCSVRLSVGGTGFQMDQDGNCNYIAPNFNTTVNRPDDNQAFANTAVPTGLTVVSSHSAIVFRPNHRAVTSAGAAITTATIQLNGGVNRTITIYGDSGYAISN